MCAGRSRTLLFRLDPEAFSRLRDTGEAQAQAATPGQPSRPRRPPASVLTSPAEEKIVDVRLDAIGTAQAIASVTLRARIDSVITAVHVKDGAIVKVGDPLFTLDNRQINALIRQAEAQLARNKASLEGAQRAMSCA